MVVLLKPSALFFFLLHLAMALLLSLSPSSAQDSPTGEVLIAEVGHPSPSFVRPKFSPFRPSMAVIVGALTSMFSITFLLLLYAKHCKRGGGAVGLAVGVGDRYQYHQSNYSAGVGDAGRKNSGVDGAVVESLPVFRFGALRGGGRHREGLECAVCLGRFERSEVLRLLPKCRHAFHVECVDTWLDAHSTCPLCRFRVDPEDILLVLDAPPPHHHHHADVVEAAGPNHNNKNTNSDTSTGAGSGTAWFRRVSGRHSSAGERVFQLVDTASFRRSLDSWKRFRNNNSKRDSASRKDGMLLGRLEHRIVVSSPGGGPGRQRWSDVQPSDLLYLRSEMIMSDAAAARRGGSNNIVRGYGKRQEEASRSVSEITGVSRFSNDSNREGNDRNNNQHRAGVLSRWTAWVSELRPPSSSNDNSNSNSNNNIV